MQGGAIRQVLRKPQMDAVVDRDDIRSRREGRYDVVRRVEQVNARARERTWNADLFLQRIVAGGFGHRHEPWTQRAKDLYVRRRAQQHVLGVIVLPGELPKQVTDIGADAVVMQLSGVDSDPHGAGDSIGGVAREAGARA